MKLSQGTLFQAYNFECAFELFKFPLGAFYLLIRNIPQITSFFVKCLFQKLLLGDGSQEKVGNRVSPPKFSFGPYKNPAAAFSIHQVNYRADYEKNKLNYTLPQDVPQLVKARTNAQLFSEVSGQWGGHGGGRGWM